MPRRSTRACCPRRHELHKDRRPRHPERRDGHGRAHKEPIDKAPPLGTSRVVTTTSSAGRAPRRPIKVSRLRTGSWSTPPSVPLPRLRRPLTVPGLHPEPQPPRCRREGWNFTATQSRGAATALVQPSATARSTSQRPAVEGRSSKSDCGKEFAGSPFLTTTAVVTTTKPWR